MSQMPFILTGPSLRSEDDCYVPYPPADSIGMKEDDCACPATQLGMVSRTSLCRDYSQTPDTVTVELPHGFHVALSPVSPTGPCVLNSSAWQRWKTFTEPQALRQKIDRELAGHLLIQPTGQQLQLQSTKSQTLTAWLHITNACNLDCPYCYVRKSSARMTESVGYQALDQIFRVAVQHGFSQVKLKFAGGEATLHFRLVKSLYKQAQKLAKRTNVDLQAVVLSNGVQILPDQADWLLANGIRLMISIDGIGELHDQLRSQRNGAGTFSQIAYTIDNVLLPRGVRPHITMTITGTNAHGAAELTTWALVERKLPLNLNFYRQNGLSASRHELSLQEENVIKGLREAYSVIEEHLSEIPMLGGLLDRMQFQAHSHTCGVGLNYLVVSHTGQIAQCHMELEAAIPLTSAKDQLLSILPNSIHNLTVDEKEGCRECAFRYQCTGGCPIETFRATGRWDVKSPYCHIYKTLLPELLRLEGLRLLQNRGMRASPESWIRNGS